MNRTSISNADIKEILLALAKAGAPKPKRGTVLGDALARFTTPDCGGVTTCDSLAAHQETVRPFAVTVTLTKVNSVILHVAAANKDEAESLVRDAAAGFDIDGPFTQYIKTEDGVNEFYMSFCDFLDAGVEVEAVEPLDPDDCMLDLAEAEGC